MIVDCVQCQISFVKISLSVIMTLTRTISRRVVQSPATEEVNQLNLWEKDNLLIVEMCNSKPVLDVNSNQLVTLKNNSLLIAVVARIISHWYLMCAHN